MEGNAERGGSNHEEEKEKSLPDTPPRVGQCTPDSSTSSVNSGMSGSPAKKSAKGKKGGQSLEEIKQSQRQLRSGKDVVISGFMNDLSLEDFKKQPKGVGFAYDAEMLKHANEWDPKHPELPDRLLKSYERCVQYGLVERCIPIASRIASEEEISKCHSQEYIDKVKATSTMNLEELKEFSAGYDGIFVNNETYNCALMAAGTSIDVVQNVVKETVKHGMALVRPPGHHAMKDEACGYCFFNNVALAAKKALELGMKRVLVVDWDVHHGQGTQYLFYNDPRVLYVSMHRYEHGQFWPNLRQSAANYIGEGKGLGYNVNIPLNAIGLTDSDYMAIFMQIILPIAYQYDPQLVIVSAGYDAAIGCPEGQNLVTPVMFGHLTNLLKQLANGKMAVIIEGGYCVDSLAESIAMTLKALLGDPCPLLPPLGQPCESMVASILWTIQHLRPYWKCLAFQIRAESNFVPDLLKTHALAEDVKVEFFNNDSRPEKFKIYDDYMKQDPEIATDLAAKITSLISDTQFPTYTHRTCLVYDKKMMQHAAIAMDHPERPQRIKRIYEKHLECGMVERCKVLKSRVATEEELCILHELDYIHSIASYADMDAEELSTAQYKYSSIYLSQAVYQSATMAAGCLLNVIDSVMLKESRTGVAIIRPPGHHAEYEDASGFCYFNNVLLSAKYAQKRHGVKKVLILDWDVHHGQGIQHQSEDDPSILYISLHRYDNGLFFPAGPDGNYDKVGVGAGEGFNINIPWNSRGLGDSDYITAFLQVVMPVAYEFAPDLVMVSAGFDAAKGDPLGGMKVSPIGYAHMTHLLMSLAEGRVILALEGGYNLHSISESMTLCTSVLLGDLCPQIGHLRPSKSAVDSITQVLDTQKKYWKSLQFRVDLPYFERENKKAEEEHTYSANVENIIDKMNDISVKGDPDFSNKDRIPSYDSQISFDSQFDGSEACGGYSTQQSYDYSLECAVGGIDPAIEASIRAQITESMENLSIFTVVPLPWCEHLSCVNPVPEGGLRVQDPCNDCSNVGENWVCLSCYQVRCSRYVQEHMLFHSLESGHMMVLSYADLSVWCYACNSYVHNDVLQPAKIAAHISKFGYPPP